MYGLRLRIEYKDINDVLSRINIYQDGYGGSADVRYASAGITVEWGDQGADGMPLIYGSSCTINFDAEVDYEFLYLFNADARKHLVEVEKASVLFWKGYIEPANWSEPLVATPYAVKCTAYDGLGSLKDTDFVDGLGAAFSGNKTLFEILQICLLKTGMMLTINTAIDWLESTQTAGTDILKVHQKNCDAYVGYTCYEVLSDIFKECRIMERLGQWWVISNSNLARTSIDYFYTTSGGSTGTGTFDPTATGYWYEGTASLDVLPGLKQLIVIQDYGYNKNLVANGDFSIYQKEFNQFEGWTNYGVTPKPQKLDKDGNIFVVIPGRQYPSNFASHGYGNMTLCMKKSIPIKTTTSVVKFGLKYAELGTKGNSLVFIMIRVVGSTNTYFLRRTAYVKKVQEFLWVNVADMATLGDDRLSLGSHLIKSSTHSYYEDGHEKPYYQNTYDGVTAYPFDTIQDHFESFDASISGIPESGTLEISLYVPYTTSLDIAGTCFTGVSVEILDENEEKYPTQNSFKAINSDRNNYVPEDVKMRTGDFPDIPNSETIYSGGIMRSDLSHTTGWKITGGSTFYTYGVFIARMMAAAQRDPRQSYQLRIADVIPRLNIVIEDINNSSRRLVENGIAYDDRFQAIGGRYTEVLSINIEQPTIVSAVKFDESTGSGSSTGSSGKPSPNPLNADERVTIATTEGIKTSSPGFLDDAYFEAVQDADSGTVVIRPLGGGIGASTYIGLTDTSDADYTAKDKYIPMVNEATAQLDLKPSEQASFFSLVDFDETTFIGKDTYIFQVQGTVVKLIPISNLNAVIQVYQEGLI